MANNRRRRQSDQGGGEQAVIENILSGLWFLLTLPFKNGRSSSRKGGVTLPPAIGQQLASHWPDIERHLQNPQTMGLAVSEADKLLDAALQAAGIIGKNMGERLQAATHCFPSQLYQQIWQAHKLRNTVAHELGTVLSTERAYSAV